MPHPRISDFDKLTLLPGSARAMGYRMPAEWEPMLRVWVDPPHNTHTWPGCLTEAQQQFARFTAALSEFVQVQPVRELGIVTNDSWIRDYGPIFVLRDDLQNAPTDQPRKALHDFHFNAWGGKYEVRDLDDVVPQHIASHFHLPMFLHEQVLEGGSIEVNGCGTVMTTGQCLLNKNRNPHLKKRALETLLHDALGTNQIIWLPGGILGDDTDGHIDDIARFVNPTTIVGLRAPENHPDHEILDRNWRVLKRARDAKGQKFDVVELPVPQPILYDFPADRFTSGGVRPIPASYANFLIANGGVLVPTFGQPTDEQALRTLEQVMPQHRIVGIRAEHLVVGLGSFHCLTMQEPM